MNETSITLAEPEDLAEAEALLTACRLPLDGFRACAKHALVARAGGRIVGCAALEVYKSGVLLRSVAVAEGQRGQGLGEALTEEAFVLARSKGANAAYLLTTTAAPFFTRFGFEVVDRADVPDDVKQSIEFTSACPSSATVMRARLVGHIW